MSGKWFHSLRFRLTLWNTVVVLIAALLALFAVREAMRITIEREARELLRDEATELELAVTESLPDLELIRQEFERKILGHSVHGWFAELLDDQGNVVWKSENYPDHSMDFQARRTVSEPFEFDKSADALLVRHTFPAGDQKRYTVLLGEPTEFIKNDIANLTRVMLMIGGALLIVAPIGGYVLAHNATQPVREIIKTTRSLNPGRLDNRLTIRGTGDELDQLSIEINSFVDQIAKYLDSHREFIANAAHELRSPVTAIQTSVEVSLGKDRTPNEYRDELETVSEQCAHLRHLVNQLLELAETDVAIQTDPARTFDAAALIRTSVDVFSGVAEEARIAIDTTLPPKLLMRGDDSKFRHVVNNLLDNALKFTPSGGTVAVSLGQSDNRVRLTVADSGPGVPEADLSRIFDRFYQVDPARIRDQRRGNGLGLSICKSIAEMYGGSITASNRTPTGLDVSVLLPRKKMKLAGRA